MKHLKYFLILLTSFFYFSPINAVQTDYRMYCFYTPQFETLFKEYFLPSLKDDFEIIVKEYPEDCLSGNFREEGWDITMLNKLKLLREAILENWDQVFFYSDIDIIFLQPILDSSIKLLGDNDFVVQHGWPNKLLCAGFFVMRGNEKNLQLIDKAYVLLKNKVCVDDQTALQKVLDGFKNNEITWKFLPSEQYPNGRRILKESKFLYSENSEIKLNSSILLFHANCCIGLENKYHFLRKVQREFLKLYPPKD